MGAPAKHSSAEKHSSLEWQALPRDLEACLAAQDELMRMPVDWPGFHALCLESVDEQTLSVRLHSRSGKRGESGTYSLRVDAAPSLTEGLIAALQERLMKYEFQPADRAPRARLASHNRRPLPSNALHICRFLTSALRTQFGRRTSTTTSAFTSTSTSAYPPHRHASTAPHAQSQLHGT